MAKIQHVTKGDIIVERHNGKNRMTPVNKVELNACSKRSVHINGNACYDWGTDVRIAEGDGTLGDLEKEVAGLGDLEEDFDPGLLLTVGDVQKVHEEALEALADKLVKR